MCRDVPVPPWSPETTLDPGGGTPRGSPTFFSGKGSQVKSLTHSPGITTHGLIDAPQDDPYMYPAIGPGLVHVPVVPESMSLNGTGRGF